VSEYTKDIDIITDINDRMAFVVEASRRNVQNKTGGPFAAAVFEKESARLISLGVNLVTTQHLSMLHAEMVAISLANEIATISA
jgi:tRNA(Arg) A34 adenosine deaminase TadA